MTDDFKARLAEVLARSIDTLQRALDLLLHGGPEPEAEHCRHCPHCRQRDHVEVGGSDMPPASNFNPLPSRLAE